ncbi:MAG: YwqG family protein [Planctomycetota bacterium]
MQQSDAEALVRETLPDGHSEWAAANLRPCVRVKTLPVSSQPGRRSWLGGSPELPMASSWPVRGNGRPLVFLAQIDFAEVAAVSRLDPLPDSGTAWFFYDDLGDDGYGGPWGFDPKDRDGFRVIYDASDAPRSTATMPDVDQHLLEARGVTSTEGLVFARRGVVFEAGWTLPLSHDFPGAKELEADAFDTILSGIEDFRCEASGGEKGSAKHQMLGVPHQVQGDMPSECELVTHGIYIGDSSGYQSPESRRLLDGPGLSEWRLLLQLSTDDGESGPGWMWGDDGFLYFWVREKDLIDRTFDRAWCILQCY